MKVHLKIFGLIQRFYKNYEIEISLKAVQTAHINISVVAVEALHMRMVHIWEMILNVGGLKNEMRAYDKWIMQFTM
jgi:hypothetical protein